MQLYRPGMTRRVARVKGAEFDDKAANQGRDEPTSTNHSIASSNSSTPSPELSVGDRKNKTRDDRVGSGDRRSVKQDRNYDRRAVSFDKDDRKSTRGANKDRTDGRKEKKFGSNGDYKGLDKYDLDENSDRRNDRKSERYDRRGDNTNGKKFKEPYAYEKNNGRPRSNNSKRTDFDYENIPMAREFTNTKLETMSVAKADEVDAIVLGDVETVPRNSSRSRNSSKERVKSRSGSPVAEAEAPKAGKRYSRIRKDTAA